MNVFVLVYFLFIPIINQGETKICIAWAHRHETAIDNLGVNCYQDWGVESENPEPEFIRYNNFSCDYVPYGTEPPESSINFYEQLEALGNYTDTLLFLNEPDRMGQCLKSPEEAATIYLTVTTMCPGCQLTMPQVSHGDYLNGWQWTRQFIGEVITQTGYLPDVSYGSFHVYDMPVTPLVDSYCAMLIEVGYESCLPLLLTEYSACNPDMLRQVTGEILADSRIERAFYFTTWQSPGWCSNLYKTFSETELTELGEVFKQLMSPYLN